MQLGQIREINQNTVWEAVQGMAARQSAETEPLNGTLKMSAKPTAANRSWRRGGCSSPGATVSKASLPGTQLCDFVVALLDMTQ